MTVEAQIEDIPTSNTDNAFTVESHVNVTFTEEMNGVLSHNEVEMDTDVTATRNGLDRDVFLNGTVDKKSSHDFNEINSCSETNNIATSKLWKHFGGKVVSYGVIYGQKWYKYEWPSTASNQKML